jgi:hypothetical protein
MGDVAHVVDFFEERIKVGARHFAIAATRGSMEENLTALRDEIIPYFGGEHA